MKNFKKYIEKYETAFLNDLQALIKIPSVRDLSTKEIGKPFGTEIARSFDVFETIAKRMGFEVTNFDGYAIHASTSEDLPYIGVLAHLDVVEAEEHWDSDPFTMQIKDNILYGRGVSDDKGPLLAALYAMYILKEQGLITKPIRLIAGGAEETTWECMEYYFKKNPQPEWGFSPDGNFPIVNGEKGILQVSCQFHGFSSIKVKSKKRLDYVCEEVEVELPINDLAKVKEHAKQAISLTYNTEKITLVYRGDVVLSRNPQRGVNALNLFFEDFKNYSFDDEFQKLKDFYCTYLLDDNDGSKLGIAYVDEDMGSTSMCPMSVTWNEEVKEVCIDVRYVKGVTMETILEKLHQVSDDFNINISIIKERRLLYVEEDSQLIQSLKHAYKKVMGEEAEVLTKGGASYARVLDRGIVFGATFGDYNTRVHMANENIPKKDLLLAMEIYCEALYLLSNQNDV